MVASLLAQDRAGVFGEFEIAANSPLRPESWNPMSPLYMRSREQRARAPKPIKHRGQHYDVVGVSRNAELLLRDRRAVHQDVCLEDFAERSVMLDGICWQVVSLEATPGLNPLEIVPTLQLVDRKDVSHLITVSHADMERVRFSDKSGEHIYVPGRIKHGIMRLTSTVTRRTRRMLLRPGQQFEARLRHRELQGSFVVQVNADNQLVATGLDYKGRLQRIAVTPAEIIPRYKRVMSQDFGAMFDVDTFAYYEDQLRGQATQIQADPDGGPLQDPLFGTLLLDNTELKLTNGADHLNVFEQFICKHARPSQTCIVAATRQLTILNLSMSNQGDARCVLDALIEFRRQNLNAKMSIVASKLGPTEFQHSPEFREYLEILAKNRIEVDDYTGNSAGRGTRQVMHGKAIIIDDHVLFSTGAVMDTRPINKADFSLELPHQAATMFRKYVNEAVHQNASHERRAELAVELAALGVVINDPVAGLTCISRAQNALIQGARYSLVVSLSELVDPTITQLLIHRAVNSVDVTIQVRELDLRSAQLLSESMKHHSNIRLEDSSWWEPRPHWNAIIADGTVAYLGSSYLWSTQRNMVHQGRSFENGVLLHGEAASKVCVLINNLRSRNMFGMTFNISKLLVAQYRLSLRIMSVYAETLLGELFFNIPIPNPLDIGRARPKSNDSQAYSRLLLSNFCSLEPDSALRRLG